MELSFELSDYGYTLCPIDWGIQDEFADFCRIYYVLGGTCIYKDKFTCFKLKKNHLYILPDSTLYSLSQDLNDRFSVLWFHVQFNDVSMKEIRDLKVKYDSSISRLLFALEGLIYSKSTLLKALPLLWDLIGEELIPNSKQYRFFDVREYAKVNISGDLSVIKLAQAANMERCHFSREFKKDCGMPPQMYIMAMRMEYATKLLVQGECIESVSAQCGYESPKSFSTAFKQIVGITPSKYKQKQLILP